MFKRIDGANDVPAGTMTFDGRQIDFHSGDTVASALLAAGVEAFRDHPLDGTQRAAYCMMGACFECLMQIDGKQNQQACLMAARPGMILSRQIGARLLPTTRDE